MRGWLSLMFRQLELASTRDELSTCSNPNPNVRWSQTRRFPAPTSSPPSIPSLSHVHSIGSIPPTMAAAMESQIRLAQQLPPRLLNFFKKYPPPQIRTATTPSTLTDSSSSSSSSDSPAAVTETTMTDSSSGLTDKKLHNPFLPFKNPRTGLWHGPAYSLRRQADLYKLAKAHFVLDLMPIAPKHPEVKAQKRLEKGLLVQGTGEGKRVKGKLWERQLRSKMDQRRQAMEGMNEMVKNWKERGHGRGWKKWPK